jgi:prephenate dehydrogenase
MKNFGDQLELYRDMQPNNPARLQTLATLNSRAYEVAHAIRDGIESAWGQDGTRPARSCPTD